MSINIDSIDSSMRAIERSTQSHAHNLANIMTDNYKAERVTPIDEANGGVGVNVSKDTTPGVPLPEESGESGEMSNVDIVEEMVGLIADEAALKVNVDAAGMVNKSIGSVLDIVI